MMVRHWFLCSSRKNRLVPFFLRLAGQALDVQKTVCDGQKGCDITWGYVARMMICGWGGVGFNSNFRVGAWQAARKF